MVWRYKHGRRLAADEVAMQFNRLQGWPLVPSSPIITLLLSASTLQLWWLSDRLAAKSFLCPIRLIKCVATATGFVSSNMSRWEVNGRAPYLAVVREANWTGDSLTCSSLPPCFHPTSTCLFHTPCCCSLLAPVSHTTRLICHQILIYQ